MNKIDPVGPGYRTFYAPACECRAEPKPTLNYAGHEIASPTCGACGARWVLVEALCWSFVRKPQDVPAPEGAVA